MVVCGLVVRFLRCGFSAAPACTLGERDFLRAFVVLPGELCPRTQTVQKYTDRRPDGIEENSRVSRIFQSIVSRSPWTQLAIESVRDGDFRFVRIFLSVLLHRKLAVFLKTGCYYKIRVDNIYRT